MKRTITLAVLIFVSSILLAPDISKKKKEEIEEVYEAKQQRLFKEKELHRFLTDLALSESGGDYTKVNTLNYIGKYQFGKLALRSTGYGYISSREFRFNPEVWPEHEQEIAMLRLLMKNEAHLSDLIAKYEGKTVRGVKITKSSILASAHLGGASGTRKFLESGYNPSDKYGTRLSDYMKKFSGYQF